VEGAGAGGLFDGIVGVAGGEARVGQHCKAMDEKEPAAIFVFAIG